MKTRVRVWVRVWVRVRGFSSRPVSPGTKGAASSSGMLRALVARKDGKRCNSVSAASGDDLVRHVGGTLLDGAARQAEP